MYLENKHPGIRMYLENKYPGLFICWRVSLRSTIASSKVSTKLLYTAGNIAPIPNKHKRMLQKVFITI